MAQCRLEDIGVRLDTKDFKNQSSFLNLNRLIFAPPKAYCNLSPSQARKVLILHLGCNLKLTVLGPSGNASASNPTREGLVEVNSDYILYVYILKT